MLDRRFAPQHANQPRPQHANVVAGPFAPPRLPQDKLLRHWKLVKRARFNAAKRLERKSSASITTLAVVAFYTGSASLFTLTFRDAIPPQTTAILDFTAQFFGFFTLLIGLIEQLKDYPSKARELHDCARKINALQKQLEVTQIGSPAELQPFLDRYDQYITECRSNHDDVDYRLAEAQAPVKPGAEADSALRWAKTGYQLGTYWFYALIWVSPPLVALALWALLVPPSRAG